MPELPEVETTRCGIAPHVEGRIISQLLLRQPSLRWPVPAQLPSLLAGEKVTSVHRRAKYLLFSVSSGQFIVHLGMSGSLRLVPADTPPRKHDHVDWQLDNGTALRFHDPRRFGALLWQPAGEQHPLLANLGPEPLSDAFSAERLFALSRGRRSAVKTFIMDNAVVVGVGNIYANEALFMAGIRPDRAAGRIAMGRYERLAEAIRTVLSRAIAMGGTTLRDFVGGDGSPGYFRQSLQVYGREGEPCRSCGQPLRAMRLGQRNTVFCPACQR